LRVARSWVTFHAEQACAAPPCHRPASAFTTASAIATMRERVRLGRLRVTDGHEVRPDALASAIGVGIAVGPGIGCVTSLARADARDPNHLL
jgi:hypothetical protein